MGSITKSVLALVVFILISGAISSPVFAAASKNKHEIDKDLAGLFTKFDKNHDKFLDKPEVTQVATAAFTLRDVNKDGVIDKAERNGHLGSPKKLLMKMAAKMANSQKKNI